MMRNSPPATLYFTSVPLQLNNMQVWWLTPVVIIQLTLSSNFTYQTLANCEDLVEARKWDK